MEAKDTVMNDKQIEEVWDKKSIGLTFQDLRLVAAAQAEISFKAGIREVVDWVMEHSDLDQCNPTLMAYASRDIAEAD
jgi:hypothetical protein